MKTHSNELGPETFSLTPRLKISRILTGLWQVADIERRSGPIDKEKGADKLQHYANAGFNTFDMADHYGTSEIIAGALLKRKEKLNYKPIMFTKWCPKPGPMTTKVVRTGIEERLARLGTSCIDLLQFHWWNFQHPAWLDALHEIANLREKGLIKEIGVTNFDAAHLHLAMADGIPLKTNQVSFSLVDRRAAGLLADLCKNSSVKILAYGTLCGGFLTEKWLDAKEPIEIKDWSKMKYKRFIDKIGGWEKFQIILKTAKQIANKYNVSISNVATRWVLEQTSVAGVIIGARLGENIHTDNNLKVFSFELDYIDHERLKTAFSTSHEIPGDCGDEYRKPPFLTASGDLSHHLSQISNSNDRKPIPHRSEGSRIETGSEWESIAGYCRAQRVGNQIFVSGTTATAGLSKIVAKDDAGAQTTFILDKILEALSALGGSAEDIVRTRIYIVSEDDVHTVSRAHGRVFEAIKPVNTLIVVKKLIGDYRVEIEAEALLNSSKK
ncbi:MAG: aldo/keto reductase [Paracoccaceae bacterium]|nr:aldo/keto reductase [Paracoccaceae bacterium]